MPTRQPGRFQPGHPCHAHSLLYSIFFAAVCGVSQATPLEVRSIDGSGNNLGNTNWGKAHTQLIRLSNPAYHDGKDAPRGGENPDSSLPSARAISNAVSEQKASKPSGLSSWFWQWGQFLDHDIDLTEGASPAEEFNIQVPTGDMHFDPLGTGDKEIGLNRSIYTYDTNGVRQQTNEITAYIDASMVYGSDQGRANFLRLLDGSGKLKTSTGNGEILLPYNDATSPLGNAESRMFDPEEHFIAGDVRANEQIGLTATHTLFVREHNRLADQFDARLDDANDSINDLYDETSQSKGDFIYEAARKVIGAQIQKITYNEFLPALLGENLLESYDPVNGYKSDVDASIANEFSTAAFRVGHTMLPSQLFRSDDMDPFNVTPIELSDAFFRPDKIKADGIDSLLLGMMLQPSQKIDTLIIDDVRNLLFGPPGAGGFDLASLNIQRGRDHGLPGYNEVRESLGLGKITSFDQLTDDPLLAAAFASVYSNVDQIDLWAGGLAESYYSNAVVGETFMYILKDQFERLLYGDRFFFMNQSEMDVLNILDPNFMWATTLSNIIGRNTNYDGLYMPENAFVMAYVPSPATALLMVFGLALLWRSRQSA